MVTPLDAAWSLLKTLEPAAQDDPYSGDRRWADQMQRYAETYTPRGSKVLPGDPMFGQTGGIPDPLFGEEWSSLPGNEWMRVADLNLQADTARNPGDARMLRERAATMLEQMEQPEPEPEPEFDLAQHLAELNRRARVPYSYRRKVKPMDDREVASQLRAIRNFRGR